MIVLEKKTLTYIYPIQYYNKSKKCENHTIKDFEKIIAKTITLVSKVYNNYDDKEIEIEIEKEIRDLLIVFSTMIKNDFHSNEKEWRYLLFFGIENLENKIKVELKNNNLVLIAKAEIFEKYQGGLISYNTVLAASNSFDFIKKIKIGPKYYDNKVLRENIYRLVSKYNKDLSIDDIEHSDGKIN